MKNLDKLLKPAVALILLITAGCASQRLTQEQKDRDSFYKEMMADTETDLAIEGDESPVVDLRVGNEDEDADIESELR